MAAKPIEAGGGKYQPDTLIRVFRMAAAFRNEMLEAGFSDNGGAIHSAERILNILGMRLNYPGLNHINNLKHFKGAEFSVTARKLHKGGDKVVIEHVAPLRHLTRMVIEKIEKGASDKQLKSFLRRHYRLVLLSPTEMQELNRLNRSEVTRDRLVTAGIKVAKPSVVTNLKQLVSSAKHKTKA